MRPRYMVGAGRRTYCSRCRVPRSCEIFCASSRGLSAGFALTSDVAMLFLGGDLKRKEKLSARLGDILSQLYIASTVVKRYEDEGRPSCRPAIGQMGA